MRSGFIFNHNKCVACGACGAACVLENGWALQPRAIYTYNTEALPFFPLVNLSLACNHCETAVCLDGCPTAAYERDTATGAVIIDEKKCTGCKYCQWNCPYDAPKYDLEKGIIGKCNLCYSGFSEGRTPACSNACPTGALRFGELSEPLALNNFSWFPDKNLNPAINLTGRHNSIPLRIIPEKIIKNETPISDKKKRSLRSDWSLIAFSFLTTISVSIVISSLYKSAFPDKILFSTLIFLSGLISLFHLGKRVRAWRVLSNLRTSPLSREIATFIIYSVISIIAVFSLIPGVLLTSSILGLILLISIDSVYIYADKRKSVVLHSGQTFVSALLIISFFSSAVLPFIFIAILKLVLSGYLMYINKPSDKTFVFRFFRIALLIISGASLVLHNSNSDNIIILIFLTGELFDRIIFYIDFDPINITSLINKQLNASNNERKRG